MTFAPRTPIPPAETQALTGTAPAAPATVAPPTAEDVRAALKEVPITMYSTSWCPHCERARRWFRSNSISFVEYDVEANPDAKRAQRKLNPKGGVPTIDVDGVVEVGFSEQRVGKAISASVERRLRAGR